MSGGDGFWLPLPGSGGGGSGSGGLVAAMSYTATGDSAYNSAGATSLADVHAANVALPFEVPASGKVLVRLGASCNSTGGDHFWGVREGTTVVAGPQEVSVVTSRFHRSVDFLITGLTPGVAKTYKFAHFATGGNSAFVYFGAPSRGAITMAIWEVP